VHLVDDLTDPAKPVHHLPGQLEAQIHLVGPDVEQEIAGQSGP
jgi:hypothetical protein